MPKVPGQVSVTVEGRKWTIEVEASSLYRAVFAYNSDQKAGSFRHYPPLTPDLPIEVELEDGRKFTTTMAAANRWASRRKV